MTKQWHTVETIAPGTYRIDESGVANAYLLEGRSRALLIDTGNGTGDIGAFVAGLTKLPLDTVLTHRHCDHAGGAGFFERVYVHEADTAFVYALCSSRPASRWLANRHDTKFEFGKQPHRARLAPIRDGHRFDLGGRTITAVHAPGHTRGSILLLDARERLLFTGDAASPTLWLWLPGSCSVEAWLPTGKRVLALTDAYTPFSGHNDGRQDPAQIRRSIALAEALLASTRRNAFPGRTACFPAQDANVHIQYNTGRVFGR